MLQELIGKKFDYNHIVAHIIVMKRTCYVMSFAPLYEHVHTLLPISINEIKRGCYTLQFWLSRIPIGERSIDDRFMHADF